MRFDLAPLLAGGMTHRALAEAVGVELVTVRKWAVRGLSRDQADQLAAKFGAHPSTLWPDWCEAVSMDLCASYGCGAWFEVPAGRGGHQVYCSPRCKNREKKRRYRNTPHGAATNRRHRNRYYDEHERDVA